MNIMAISMASNAQPVNRLGNRRNSIRFMGNPPQDSLTLSSSSAGKSQNPDFNQILEDLDKVLTNPDSTKKDRKLVLNHLTEICIYSAARGNSESADLTEKLFSRLNEALDNPSIPPETKGQIVYDIKWLGRRAFKAGQFDIAEKAFSYLNKALDNPGISPKTKGQIAYNIKWLGRRTFKAGQFDIAEKALVNLIDNLNNPSFSNPILNSPTTTIIIDDLANHALLNNNTQFARSAITVLGKLATSPKSSWLICRNAKVCIHNFIINFQNSTILNNDETTARLLEDWGKAKKDLAPYRKKARKLDKRFRDKELCKDLALAKENFKAKYDARPKTLHKDVDQRYKKFLEYFERREISEYIFGLGKHAFFGYTNPPSKRSPIERLPTDKVREILEIIVSPSSLNAALERIKR